MQRDGRDASRRRLSELPAALLAATTRCVVTGDPEGRS